MDRVSPGSDSDLLLPIQECIRTFEASFGGHNLHGGLEMFDGHVKRVVKSVSVTLFVFAILLLGVAAPRAQDASAQPRIPDVNCLDQDGKKLRFHTDLVKGKVVVINFIYTSCPYMCTRIGEDRAFADGPRRSCRS